MSWRQVLLVMVACWLVLSGRPRTIAERPLRNAVTGVPIVTLSDWDHRNLELNLRWILQRERQAAARKAKVAVFADAGVWHVGARSIVAALEQEKVPCRVIDRSRLRGNLLREFEVLILPGGWAPYQREAMEKVGWEAVKTFVKEGGRCLAVCAGAYLVTRETDYEGTLYPYPIGLFDGTAKGPIPGLAIFPQPGSVTVTVTEAGKRRGLDAIAGHACYFSGGPCFAGGSNVEVLAEYPDKSAAAISRTVGKGEVILLGMHAERPAPEVSGDDGPVPEVAGKLFRKLLFKQ